MTAKGVIVLCFVMSAALALLGDVRGSAAFGTLGAAAALFFIIAPGGWDT